MTVLLQVCVYIYCIRCANIYSSLSFQLFWVEMQKGIAGLYGGTVILCLIFQEAVILFSTVTALFYLHLHNAKAFQFFYILASTCYFLFLFCFK